VFEGDGMMRLFNFQSSKSVFSRRCTALICALTENEVSDA
jgi:hypothetical protein